MNEPIQPNLSESARLYCSYLLRLWCTDQAEIGCWRASLEDSHTRARIAFASLEELFAFLIDQVEGAGSDSRS